MKYINDLCGALALVKNEMTSKGLKSIKVKDVMKNITKVGNHYYFHDDSFKVPYVRINKDGSYKVVLSIGYITVDGKRTYAHGYTKESIFEELSNGFNTVKVRNGFVVVKGKGVDITA